MAPSLAPLEVVISASPRRLKIRVMPSGGLVRNSKCACVGPVAELSLSTWVRAAAVPSTERYFNTATPSLQFPGFKPCALTLSDHLSTPQAKATERGYYNTTISYSCPLSISLSLWLFGKLKPVSDGQDGSSFDGIAKSHTSYHVLRFSYVGGWPSCKLCQKDALGVS